VIAQLTLAAMERAERFGARAAWRVALAALDAGLAETDARSVVLRALGAAVRSGEGDVFAEAVARWASAGGESTEPRGLSLVARLAAEGHDAWAMELAEAEAVRFGSSDAFLVCAALHDAAGDRARATARLEAAFAAPSIDAAARARVARARVLADPTTAAERAKELSTASPREALRLARSALEAKGLYARVAALDRLAEVARDPSLARAALRLALRHVDRRGAGLTDIERDRVRQLAVIAGAPAETIAAIDHPAPTTTEARARAALMGDAPTGGEGAIPLVVLAALSRGEVARASAPLDALARSADAAPIEWTAVMTALAHASLREKALACVSRWLEADAPPPRGWLALAALLERVASSSLAERALERAVAAAERGAHAALADRLERAAWAAYDRGDLELAERLATRAVALEG
jgi:hypothetical protein